MNSAYEWVKKRTRPAKPNNKTMKYKVKTRQLRSFDIGDIVEKRNGGYWLVTDNKNHCISLPTAMVENSRWFEAVEEVQEGQYRQYEVGGPIRIMSISDDKVVVKLLHNDEERLYSIRDVINGTRKLSTDEIEQAIKEEAKRRGFKDGQQVKRGWVGVSEESTIKGDVASGGYFPMDDSFLMSGFGMIYKEGEFAELVDQTPDIEINGYEVELHDDCVKVGCEVLSPQFIKELNVILQKHGAEFIVSGNDISSQIRQIAKHYGNMAGEPVELSGSFDVSGIGFSATNMWKAND